VLRRVAVSKSGRPSADGNNYGTKTVLRISPLANDKIHPHRAWALRIIIIELLFYSATIVYLIVGARDHLSL
jgi:hypothetical protein